MMILHATHQPTMEWPPELIPESPAWMAHAACRDMFFPVEANQSDSVAKRSCRRCPVKADCLDYALERRERHGIWGGTSEAERERMLRKQAS